MAADEVNTYLEELPRLIAEENLRWADIIGIGNGLLKKHESRRILKAWREAARKGMAERHKDRFDPVKDRQKVRGFGVAVREAKNASQ